MKNDGSERVQYYKNQFKTEAMKGKVVDLKGTIDDATVFLDVIPADKQEDFLDILLSLKQNVADLDKFLQQ